MIIYGGYHHNQQNRYVFDDFSRTTRDNGGKFQNDDQKNITILMIPKLQ